MLEEKDSLAHMFSVMYEELRRIASRVRRDDPSQTLNPTALVNEAYIKLAGPSKIEPASDLHFKRIAARAMRQVLVEAARRRLAEKRGGGQAMVTFDDSVAGRTQSPEEILALDSALEGLSQLNPRQAQLVELRFFGGLGVSETADALQVSPSTVERDWRSARAWLSLHLQ